MKKNPITYKIITKDREVQKIYDELHSKGVASTFMQSYQWWKRAQLHSTANTTVAECLAFYQNKTLLGVTLVEQVNFTLLKLRVSRYLEIIHGPLFVNDLDESLLSQIITLLKQYATYKRANCVRIAPSSQSQAALFAPYTRPSKLHVVNEDTWRLSLPTNETELMTLFNSTTKRYVKHALKDTRLTFTTTHIFTDEHYQLYKTFAFEKIFSSLPLSLIQAEIQAFGEKAIVGEVRCDGELVSVGLFIEYLGTLYYHLGSNKRIDKTYNSYLLHYNMLLYCLAHGIQTYDFWGIAPRRLVGKRRHPWDGFSQFKRGFSGYEVNRGHAQDIVTGIGYSVQQTVEKYRARKKGFWPYD